MPLNYQDRSAADYRRRASEMIQAFEGYRSGPYDAGDNMATIGFGYTFNRNNNLDLWDRAGVDLSQVERQRLAAIDAAPAGQKTALGLAFNVQITRDEARSLLENASLSNYERPATNLGMPESDERAVVVSLTYNRGQGRMATHMQGFNDAINDGDRAEAWYQLRYNSRGTNPDPNSQLGLRARRNMESRIFGLYDDPQNVTHQEALDVYRMFQLHREDILENERNWGVDLDGNRAQRNAIAQANRNYPDLTREYGEVETLAVALEPARTRLLNELRAENPELADRLRDADFASTAIYLDPGRGLRTGNSLRPDQRNNTSQDVDQNHAATIDSRRMRGNAEVDSNDLLIGGGGDDTLRSHRGDDILIGGQGRDRMEGGAGHDVYVVGAGDRVLDSDGVGEMRWNGQQLTGGSRSEADPSGTYRSADGRFTYVLDGTNLTITDAQATDPTEREGVVVENFQNGQMGVTSGPSSSAPESESAAPQVPAPTTPSAQRTNLGGSANSANVRPYSDRAHPDHSLFTELRDKLPSGVSDEKVAEFTLAARQGGVQPGQVESVHVHDGKAWALGTSLFDGMVNLRTPALPMAETMQKAEAFEQQHQAQVAQRQEQQHQSQSQGRSMA